MSPSTHMRLLRQCINMLLICMLLQTTLKRRVLLPTLTEAGRTTGSHLTYHVLLVHAGLGLHGYQKLTATRTHAPKECRPFGGLGGSNPMTFTIVASVGLGRSLYQNLLFFFKNPTWPHAAPKTSAGLHSAWKQCCFCG